MRYRVLVEVMKPGFVWLEYEAENPLDTINMALEEATTLRPDEFMDYKQLEQGAACQDTQEIGTPMVLVVLDSEDRVQYTRVNEQEALDQIEGEDPEDESGAE